MFGIGQISWGQFTKAILLILVLWYLSLFMYAWYRERNRNRKTLFEDDLLGSALPETTEPVPVSSLDFPSEVISLHPAEDIPLPVSLYEETGLDDGYAIECFTDPGNPQLPALMEQIQYQQ